MSEVTYEDVGAEKTHMRELMLILKGICSVCGKKHICFCRERKGNVVRIKMLTQVAGWAVVLTVTNCFGQLK